MQFVDNNNLRPNANARYINRNYVDKFYKDWVEIKKVNVTTPTVNQITNAINWYANNIEPEEPGNPPFDTVGAENSLVSQSLWRRELKHIQHLEHNGVQDPHANLPTRTITFEDKKGDEVGSEQQQTYSL